MIHKDDAILALRPGASFITVDGVVEWLDETLTEPTADQITAKYNELVAAEPLNEVRVVRNRLLAETDFWGNSDMTMSDDMTTYRQALRDLPAGKDTVDKCNNATWPTKP